MNDLLVAKNGLLVVIKGLLLAMYGLLVAMNGLFTKAVVQSLSLSLLLLMRLLLLRLLGVVHNKLIFNTAHVILCIERCGLVNNSKMDMATHDNTTHLMRGEGQQANSDGYQCT